MKKRAPARKAWLIELARNGKPKAERIGSEADAMRELSLYSLPEGFGESEERTPRARSKKKGRKNRIFFTPEIRPTLLDLLGLTDTNLILN